jgi:FkbM family methyltransferase
LVTVLKREIRKKAVLRAKRTLASVWVKAGPTFHVKVGPRAYVVRASSDPGTGWLLSWTPNWKTQIVDLMLSRRSGLFVDVGANIGQTLLDYSASAHGQGYVGFEPSAVCAEHLRNLVKDNGLADCTIIPAALANDNLPLTFFAVDGSDQGASLLNDIEPLKQQEKLVVPAYRFDDISSEVATGRDIAFIKVDVEGAEHLVLAGMAETLRRGRHPVLCEVLHRDPHADRELHESRTTALMRVLLGIGYKVARLDKARDGSSVLGLTPITKFPEVVYNRENADECDYLFQPDEEPWPSWEPRLASNSR